MSITDNTVAIVSSNRESIVNIYRISLNDPENQNYKSINMEKMDASSVALTPDSKILAIGAKYSGQIAFINLLEGTKLAQITAHNEPIVKLAFSTDGSYLASLGRSGIIKIWGQ
jgi:WD40 repeat protein